MFDFIEFYESLEFINEVLNNKNRYILFEVTENTLEALDKKCQQIMSFQQVNWKPLVTKKMNSVNVYVRIYYINKY